MLNDPPLFLIKRPWKANVGTNKTTICFSSSTQNLSIHHFEIVVPFKSRSILQHIIHVKTCALRPCLPPLRLDGVLKMIDNTEHTHEALLQGVVPEV